MESVNMAAVGTEPDTGTLDAVVLQETTVPTATSDNMDGLEAPPQDLDGSAQAEFEYDSDFEDSSSFSASDSSDDESSSGDSVVLDVATKARMLMAGEGDDEEIGNKTSAEAAPRTANEVEEEDIPIPDIEITQQMEITLLGAIEHIVENTAIIKGETSAEYRVLEPGSILCDQDRKVVGVVLDTIGPVQQPYYSTKLKTSQISSSDESQVQAGQHLYYVNDHSHFVFTEPLRHKKHYDASNIHDEEIPEDAQEFSDDEKEREFKAQRKEAKKAGRGGLSRSDFTGRQQPTQPSYERSDASRHMRDGDVSGERHVGGLSYDDDEVADDDGFYQPLKRPANLTQTMSDSFRGGSDRGGHRGAGRYNNQSRNDRNGRPSRGSSAHSDRGHRGFAGRGRYDNRQSRGDRAETGDGQRNGDYENHGVPANLTTNPTSTHTAQTETNAPQHGPQPSGSGFNPYAGLGQGYAYQSMHPMPAANPASAYPIPNPYIQTPGGSNVPQSGYGIPVGYHNPPTQYTGFQIPQQQYQYNGHSYQTGNIGQQSAGQYHNQPIAAHTGARVQAGGFQGLPGPQGFNNAHTMYPAGPLSHPAVPSGAQTVPSPAQQQQQIADFLAFVKTQQPPG